VWICCIEEHSEVLLCLFETMGGKRTKAQHHTDAHHPANAHKGKENNPHANQHKPSAHEHKNTAHAHEHKHTGHAHEHNKHHPHVNILDLKTFLADVKADLITYNDKHTGHILWCHNVDEIIRAIGSPETAEHRMISGIFMEQFHISKKTALAAVKSVIEKAQDESAVNTALVTFQAAQKKLASDRASVVKKYDEEKRPNMKE